MHRILLLLTTTLSLGLLTTLPALAHARFDHSTPSPEQVLSTSPPAVEIFTVQEMRKTAGANQITVTGPNGRVDNNITVVDDSNRKHFSVGMQPNQNPGRYLVDFTTLSDEDGEQDHGQFAFYVGAPPTADQRAEDAKLLLTAKTDEARAPSRTGLYTAIGVVIALIVVAVWAGVYVRRSRTRSRSSDAS